MKRGGQIVPLWIRTGLTNLDYSEVLSGLEATDSVLLLPSASLVQSQQDMKDRMIKSLKAMIPSDNNKKIAEDLIKDATYGDKIKLLESSEE